MIFIRVVTRGGWGMPREKRNRSQRGASAAVPSSGYRGLLTDIKARVRVAQIKASLSVNRELIQLYWDIGEVIVSRQRSQGWGKSVVERLAADLQKEFPRMAGSRRKTSGTCGPFIWLGQTKWRISNGPLENLIDKFSDEPLESLPLQARRRLWLRFRGDRTLSSSRN